MARGRWRMTQATAERLMILVCCPESNDRLPIDKKICRLAGTFSGTTGLEPATSGVTGRAELSGAQPR